MENTHNFEWFRLALVNHKVVAANGPEKNGLLGQIGTLMTEARIFCQ